MPRVTYHITDRFQNAALLAIDARCFPSLLVAREFGFVSSMEDITVELTLGGYLGRALDGRTGSQTG